MKYTDQELCCHGITGTCRYMAPEVITSNDNLSDLQHKYTEKCDMWSLGVILYELFYDQFDHTKYFRPVK